MTRRILAGQVVVQRARRDERLELPRGEVLRLDLPRHLRWKDRAVMVGLWVVGLGTLAAAVWWWS